MKTKIIALKVIGKVLKIKDLPPGKRAVPSRWVFACKERQHAEAGEKERSARVAYRGDRDVPDNRATGNASHTASMTTYFIMEAWASQDETIVRECWDVSGAYYKSMSRKEQYMAAPPGFDVDKDGDKVCWLLARNMPGKDDAGAKWEKDRDDYFIDHLRLRRAQWDDSVFVIRVNEGHWLVLLAHVDDFAVFGKPQALVDKIGNAVHARFSI